MKNTNKNIVAIIIISAFFFVPFFCSAQTGSMVNDGIVPGHVYSVIGTYEQDGVDYVVLRNPWGTIEVVEEEDYLPLQTSMQQENRQFTTMSNVMKTRSDVAKSSINNLR